MLQGVGAEEFRKYQMRKLNSSQLSDLAGNSSLGMDCSSQNIPMFLKRSVYDKWRLMHLSVLNWKRFAS